MKSTPPSPKEQTFLIESPAGEFNDGTQFVNRVYCFWDQDLFISIFGFISGRICGDTIGVILTRQMLTNQEQSLRKYLDQTIGELRSEPICHPNLWGEAPHKMHTADILNVSRLDKVGEIMTGTFSYHDFALATRSKSKSIETPKLRSVMGFRLRCPIEVQAGWLISMFDSNG